MIRFFLCAFLLLLFPFHAAAVILSGEELDDLKEQYRRPTDIPYNLHNPYSEAKETLGKLLFFDPRLSDSDLMSCATCHNPSFYWSDSREMSVEIPRKTMSLFNLAWDHNFGWDGIRNDLMKQAFFPMRAPTGMNLPPEKVIEKLQKIEGYKPYFKEAFGTEEITAGNVVAALEIFEMGIVSGEAPFDQWIEGDENAISESAKRGFVLFNTKAQCVACHNGWRFSDSEFHDIGIDTEDEGHANRSFEERFKFAFKAVGLRNIAERPPYFHDGHLKTLEEVIEFYNRGGDVKRDTVKIAPLNLTYREKKDLVEFLKTLSSEEPEVKLPILPR